MMNVIATEPSHAVPSIPMGAACVTNAKRTEVWMLGPIPPPVTGMTVLTREMVRAMQSAGPVRFLNWSPNMKRRSLLMRLKRNWQVFKSIAALLANGRVTNQRLYVVANSPSGLYVTALIVMIGRKLGFTVFLHHHVYTYIDHHDRRMAWIDRHMAGRGVHIVHGQTMIDDFRRRYQSKNPFLVVHPSIVGVDIGKARESSRQPFRLGLLSGLQESKGLDVAIDTFKALRAAGRDVTLTLAGPTVSAGARQLVERTVAQHPDHVRHIGPVYGSAKSQFFVDIDAFLFPTMTESWGLVLNEALGAGLPVITFNRGCTATVVGADAGLVIDPAASFVDQASRQVMRWMDDEDEYRSTSRAAVAQAEHLRREGQRTLADFVEHMFRD